MTTCDRKPIFTCKKLIWDEKSWLEFFHIEDLLDGGTKRYINDFFRNQSMYNL